MRRDGLQIIKYLISNKSIVCRIWAGNSKSQNAAIELEYKEDGRDGVVDQMQPLNQSYCLFS